MKHNMSFFTLVSIVALASCKQSVTITPSTPSADQGQLLEHQRQATRRAWRGLQDADAGIRGIQRQSEYFYRAAQKYAAIDLEDADPIFVEHIKNCVAAANKMRHVWEAIQAEVGEANQNAETITQLGAIFGIAAGNSDDPRRDAAAGGLGGAVIGEGVKQVQVSAIKEKYADQYQDANAAWKKVCADDKIVAERLSQKYGTIFIDAN